MSIIIFDLSMFICRIDADVKTIEQYHQIERWASDSNVFQDYERVEQAKQRGKVASDIETCAREGWFFLNMKTKFAGT